MLGNMEEKKAKGVPNEDHGLKPELMDEAIKSKRSKSGSSSGESDEDQGAVRIQDGGMVFLGDSMSRGNWASSVQFIFSGVGAFIGLYNVIGFPAAAFKHGGGAYLIAYSVVLLFISFPLVFLEAALGQFTSRGAGKIFKNMVPFFMGLGYGQVILQVLATITYGSTYAWTIFYFILSLRPTQIWSTCDGVELYTGKVFPTCFDDKRNEDCIRYGEDFFFYAGTCWDNHMAPFFIENYDRCIVNHKTIYDPKNRMKLKKDPTCWLKFRFPLANKAFRDFLLDVPLVNRWVKIKDVCTGSLRLDYDSLDETTNGILDLTGATKFGISSQILSGRLNNRIQKLYEVLPNPFNDTRIMIFTDRTLDLACTEEFRYKGESWLQRKAAGKDEALYNRCFMKMVVVNRHLPSELFLDETLNSGDLQNLNGYNGLFPVSLGIGWLFLFFALLAGIKYLSRLVFFVGSVPVGFGLMLALHTSYLKGSELGTDYYLQLNLCKLSDPYLWRDAVVHSMSSMGMAMGVISNLASYNRFHNDILRDTFIICVADFVFSFVLGFGVLGTIGGMAKKMRFHMDDVNFDRGDAIAFSVLAQATVEMPGSSFWTAVFFLAQGLLALTSLLAYCDATLQTVFDESYSLKKMRSWLVLLFCMICFLVSLPFVSRAGASVVKAFSIPLDGGLLLMSGLLYCVSIAIYGYSNISQDIGMMLQKDGEPDKTKITIQKEKTRTSKEDLEEAEMKEHSSIGRFLWSFKPVRYFFVASWAFISPVALLSVFMLDIADNFIGNPESKTGEMVVYLCLMTTFLMTLVSGSLYAKYAAGYTWKNMFKPTVKWGPANQEHRTGSRYAKRGRRGKLSLAKLEKKASNTSVSSPSVSPTSGVEHSPILPYPDP